MTSKEIEYAKRYKRTCEVKEEECQTGGKWCATCMHYVSDSTWTGAGFEHCYCTVARKE